MALKGIEGPGDRFGDHCVEVQNTMSATMTAIRESYRCLTLLADLNWDRLLYLATLSVALAVGALVGELFV